MYKTPIQEYEFLLQHVVELNEVLEAHPTPITFNEVIQILEESGRLASEVLAPLNAVGDRKGAILKDGAVISSPGFKEAYQKVADGGWLSTCLSENIGGQGLPHFIDAANLEMISASNMAFSLCVGLTGGAITALAEAASPELKEKYIPNLASGHWTATMNLTEPHCGTDLGSLRTSARRQDDGSYLIKGQKIFITWGEHDFTENIIHLVLARLDDAPAGVKGISLFVVPKFLVNDDGSLGQRNDLECVALEHKLGIHGSPTCVMQYGSNDGAKGFLVGTENRGLEAMFVMMNHARLGVSLQSLGVSDRAYQKAITYTHERIQGLVLGQEGKTPLTISEHPDVKKTLLSMKTQIDAVRALLLQATCWLDLAEFAPTEEQRAESQGLVDFILPIAKGWASEVAQNVTYDAIQTHGGSGFIEESGVAQFYRDARILSIYEGTTAIQSNDLLGRKIIQNEGKYAHKVIDEMTSTISELRLSQFADAKYIANSLEIAVNQLSEATNKILEITGKDVRSGFAHAVTYLSLWGIVTCGWMQARIFLGALNAKNDQAEDQFLEDKIRGAKFYALYHMPRAAHYAGLIKGGESIGDLIQIASN